MVKMKKKIVIKKLFLIFVFIVMLMPMYFMLICSLQDIHGVMKMPPDIFPQNITFKNYTMMKAFPFSTWIANTVFITLVTTITSCFITLSASYAFTFFEFPHKKKLWVLMLLTIMIPRIVLIIPSYVIVKKLGIVGTLWPAIVALLYNPGGMFLGRLYFDTIPKSLLESARLDGAHEMQVLWKIIAPMSLPIVTLLLLTMGINSMSDYIWQMLVLQKPATQTLLIGIINKATELGSTIQMGVEPIGRKMASGIILVFPLLVIFLVANKYFTQDVGGAVKE